MPLTRLKTQRLQARGFTMVELIVVVVILGVLAAMALPRLIDINSNAERAAVDGWVGALKSAQSMACNDNTISFTTKTSRAISIVNSPAGITWSATPSY